MEWGACRPPRRRPSSTAARPAGPPAARTCARSARAQHGFERLAPLIFSDKHRKRRFLLPTISFAAFSAARPAEQRTRLAVGGGPWPGGLRAAPWGPVLCPLGQRQGRGRHVCVGPPGVTSGGGRAEASRGPLTARGSAARQPRGFCFPRRTPSRGGRRSRAADDAGEGERRASGCGLRACQIPGGIAGPGVGVLRGSACGPYDVGG